MEKREEKFEMSKFAAAFWTSLFSIIYPAFLIIMQPWLWALSIWISTVLILSLALSILTKWFGKPFHIVVPLLLFPIATFFLYYVIEALRIEPGRARSKLEGYVKPYNFNWEIFNVFYFLKTKKLYHLNTDDIHSFAHHKIVYHKSDSGSFNTVIEVKDEAELALLILEEQGTYD